MPAAVQSPAVPAAHTGKFTRWSQVTTAAVAMGCTVSESRRGGVVRVVRDNALNHTEHILKLDTARRKLGQITAQRIIHGLRKAAHAYQGQVVPVEVAGRVIWEATSRHRAALGATGIGGIFRDLDERFTRYANSESWHPWLRRWRNANPERTRFHAVITGAPLTEEEQRALFTRPEPTKPAPEPEPAAPAAPRPATVAWRPIRAMLGFFRKRLDGPVSEGHVRFDVEIDGTDGSETDDYRCLVFTPARWAEIVKLLLDTTHYAHVLTDDDHAAQCMAVNRGESPPRVRRMGVRPAASDEQPARVLCFALDGRDFEIHIPVTQVPTLLVHDNIACAVRVG